MRVIKTLVVLFVVTLFLGGCGLMNKTNFETEEEAQAKCQELLKKKYGIDFEITDGELGSDIDGFEKEYQYYHATITDSDGMQAKVGLLKEDSALKLNMDLDTYYLDLNMDKHCLQDTYSEVYYTKLTRSVIENLLKDEKDIKSYYISLDNPHYAKSDLSLTADEYMDEAETAYWINIVLPDGKTSEEYADIIFPILNKLIDNQKYSFFLTFYANNYEIYSRTYYAEENAYRESYQEVLDMIVVETATDTPQPEEQYLLDDFYNGEE